MWRVTGGQEEKACPEEAYTLVREADDGRPVIGDPGGRRVLLVGTPRDVEGLRRQDAGKAMAWRMAVRDALGGAMAAGARVAGFTERGEYVVVIN